MFDDWFKQQVFQAVVFEFDNKGENDYHHWKKVFNKIQGIYGQKEPVALYMMKKFFFDEKILSNKKLEKFLKEVTQHNNLFAEFTKINHL